MGEEWYLNIPAETEVLDSPSIRRSAGQLTECLSAAGEDAEADALALAIEAEKALLAEN